jgi:hypothetical protein
MRQGSKGSVLKLDVPKWNIKLGSTQNIFHKNASALRPMTKNYKLLRHLLISPIPPYPKPNIADREL